MSENLLGFIFLVLGVWMFFGPKSALDFKAQLSQIFGIKLTYSRKALTYYKYLGAVIGALGLLMLLGFV